MSTAAQTAASRAIARLRSTNGLTREWRDGVLFRIPHDRQRLFIDSAAKRKVIRAGRRGGKTVGIAIWALCRFLQGRRVLYAAPTAEQVTAFWYEITRALYSAIDQGILKKDETERFIEVPNTKNRIRAKTAWNANTLRGDYADDLILDEFQLMNEDTWGEVGAPMLLDNDGDAVFIYTPPSLHAHSISKARDHRHAAKLFKAAQADTSGRWEAFHFTSHENPYISQAALREITRDMTALAYEQEIMAEDKDEAPGALWKRWMIDNFRCTLFPTLTRIVVGVDPPGGATECGIVVAGLGEDGHGYILGDYSLRDTPNKWGSAVVAAYNKHTADRIVGEKNYGGDMVEHTIRSVEGGVSVSYKNVEATRGKAVRAEPIAALYERGMIHHVGEYSLVEDELCSWQPNSGMASPNRLDALVWALTELNIVYDIGEPLIIDELPLW